MALGIVFMIVVGLFAAAVLWGEDSRIDFTDPRRHDNEILNRRSEFR
jgi:hypothetical protein